MKDIDPSRRVIQFQIIRGPDQMMGTRNDGGASLLFFALDSDGQMWRGTASASTEPLWAKVTGPFDAVLPVPGQ